MRDLLGVDRASFDVALVSLTEDRVERFLHIEVNNTVAEAKSEHPLETI